MTSPLLLKRWHRIKTCISFLVVTTLFFGVSLLGARILYLYESPLEEASILAEADAWFEDKALRTAKGEALYALLAGNEAATSNLTALLDELDELNGEMPNLEDDMNWTYIGTLYFIFTLVTTIGYGTFTPETREGMAASVLVGIVGVRAPSAP